MLLNLQMNYANVSAEVKGFMLLKINLPDRYENAIVYTQVMKEQEKTF